MKEMKQKIVTIVQKQLAVPLLVRWDVSAKLRNDLNYPASINNVSMLEDSKDFENVSEHPNETEIEEVKQRLFKEYADVFTDGE